MLRLRIFAPTMPAAFHLHGHDALRMTHDHIEHHTTNKGKGHGGAMLVVEYKGVKPDNWYMWKDVKHEADFYS